MSQTIKLKRSAVAGKVPTTSSLDLGEIAINTADGKAYLKKNDGSESIQTLLVTDATTTGSINIVGNVSASAFSGSFFGNGTGLTRNMSITGSDVFGNQFNDHVSVLHFDAGTGLNVSASAPDTAFIKLGSHFRDFFVDGSATIIATGSDQMDIIASGGLDISTSLTDTNGNGVSKELIFAVDATVARTGSNTFTADQTIQGKVTSSTLDTSGNAIIRGDLDVIGDINVTGNVDGHITVSPVASDSDNSNGVVIQDLSFDGFGHTRTLGTVNLDDRYFTETEADNRFVNVTGDSISGSLIVSASGATDDFKVGDNKLFVGASGNVGIGTTSPSVKLDIKGTVGLQATNSTNKWMAYTYTDNTLRLNYNGAGNDEVVIDSSGNVGIGTTSIDAKLHVSNGNSSTSPNADGDELVVENSGNAGISILTGNTSNGAIFFGDAQDNNIGIIDYDHNVNQLSFTAAATKALTINASANVGIGTTTPSVPLQVAGSISASGAIVLEDSQPIKWDTNNILSHNGTSTYLGDAASASTLTLSGGNGTFEGDLSITGGDITLGTDSIASNINAVGDVLAFKVDSNENTGGTPNIQFKVGAATELTIDGSTATFAGDIDLTAGQLELRGDVALDHDGSSLYVKAPSSIFFYPGNSNKANINSSGNFTLAGNLDINGTGTSTIDGNLTVGGTVTAQEFHTEFVSASIIYSSGSTKFGDTSDDVHSFSGSLRVTGSGDHYFTDGRVGIGTTSPGTVLDIHGTGNVLHVGTGTNVAQYMSFRGSGASGAYIGYDGTGMLLQPGDGKRFLIRTGNATWSSGTVALAVDTSGKVGIGTVTPPHKFSVFGTGAGNATVQIEGEGGADPFINFLANNTQHWALGIDDSDSDKFKLSEHSALGTNDYFVVDTSGNVGIGTNSPSEKLHTITGANTSTGIRVDTGLDNGSASTPSALDLRNIGGSVSDAVATTFNVGAADRAKIISGRYSNGGYLQIQTGNSSNTLTDRVRIDNSGNVGIGTTSPTSISGYTALEINNATNGAILDLSQGDTMRGRFVATTSSMALETSGSIPILFQPAGTERMRIDSGGTTTITATSGTSLQNATLQLKTTNGSNNAGLMFINAGNASSYNDIAGIASFVESGDAKGNLRFWTRNSDGDNSDVDERMRINSSGNVGIGASSLAAFSDGFVSLQIKNAANNISSNGSSYLEITQNANFNSGWKYVNSAAASRYEQGIGSHFFFTAPSGTAGNAVSWDERMRIDSSGNVLMGTTNTTWQTVAGLRYFNGSSLTVTRNGGESLNLNRLSSDGDIATFRKDGTTVGSIGTVASRLVIASSNTGVTFQESTRTIYPSNTSGAGQNNVISLGNNGTKFKDLHLGGHAKIATALTASGLIYPTSDGTANQVIGTDGSGNLSFISPGAATAFPFTGDAKITGSLIVSASGATNDFQVGDNKLFVSASGNVGIGTTSPDKLLTVGGSSSTSGIGNDGIFVNIDGGAAVTAKSGTSGVEIQLNAESNVQGTLGTYSNHPLAIRVNNSNKMYFSTNGNVGIGTASPTAKFDVAGSVQIGAASATPNVAYGLFGYTGVGLGIYSAASGGTQGIGFWLNNGSAYEAGRWLSNGNLGIGTTTPTTKLEIRKDSSDTTLTAITSTNDTISLLNETDTTNNYTSIGFVGNAAEITARIASVADASNGRGNLVFLTGDSSSGTPSERMRIDSSGNVGIGETTPASLLHLSGSSNNAIITLENNGNGNVSGLDFVRERSTGPGVNGGSLFLESNTGGTQSFLYLQAQTAGADAGITSALTAGNGVRLVLKGGQGIFSVETGASETFKVDNGDVTLTGDLTVGGTVTAQEFHTEFVSASIIYQSGSTKFGDSNDDNHDFTGSLNVNAVTTQTIGVLRSSNTSTSANNGGALLAIRNSSNTDGNQESLIFQNSNGTGTSGIFAYNVTQSTGEGLMTFGVRNSSGTFGEKMRIDGNGNVGIGTSSPSQVLHVKGNILVEDNDSTDTVAQIGNSGDDGWINLYANGVSKAFVGANTTSYFNGGNVGIGTTSPSSKLHATSADSNTIFTLGNTGTGGVDWAMYSANNSSAEAQSGGDLLFRNASSNILILQNDGDVLMPSGNVGIGTTSPSAKLDIKGDGADFFLQSNDFKIARIQPRGTGADLDKGLFSLFDGSTEDVRIDTSGNSWFNGGNVGIGETSPASPLSVEFSDSGTTQASLKGLILANSDSTTNNGAVIAFPYGGSASNSFARMGAIHTNRTGGSETTDLFFGTIHNGAYGERMRIDSSGNVGIGTSSPNGIFHVYGNNSSTYITNQRSSTKWSEWHVGGTDHALMWDSSSDMRFMTTTALGGSGASEKMRIDSSGRVGIGVTPESWTVFTPIQIGQASTFAGRTSANQTDVANNWYYDGAEKRINAGYAQRYVQDSSGDHYWLTAGTSTADSTISFSTPMIIKNGGNVGIGTTSPGSALDVAGILTINTRDIASNPRLVFNHDNILGASFIEVDRGTEDMEFWVSGSERMRIMDNGNVGIGTTSPSMLLDIQNTDNTVASTSSSPSQVRIFNHSLTTGATSGIALGLRSSGTHYAVIENESGGANTSNLVFKTEKDNVLAERMRINTSGSILGTGTYTAGNSIKIFEAQRLGGAVAGDWSYDDATTDMSLGTSTAHSFSLKTSNARALTIESGGALTFPTISSVTSTGASISHLSSNGYLYIKGGAGGLVLGDDSTASRIQIEDNSNIRLETAGSERMRITSSGYTEIKAVSGASRLYLEGTLGTHFLTGTSGGDFGIYNDTNSSYRLYITAGGNVGIGTTSPSAKLMIETGADEGIRIYRSGTNANFGAIEFRNSDDSATNGRIGWNANELRQEATSTISFHSNSSERMRIDSSGNVMVGKTATGLGNQGAELSATGQLKGTAANQVVAYLNRTSSDGTIAEFRKDNTAVGSIGTTGGNLTVNSEGAGGYGRLQTEGTDAYIWYSGALYPASNNSKDLGTSSLRFKDLYLAGTATVGSLVETSTRKLKKDITELEDQSSIVDSLQPVSYTWKETEKEDFGLVAEDVADIAPHLVERDEEGNPSGIKYSKLSVLLLDVVQRQSTLIEDLNKRITKLENERGN